MRYFLRSTALAVIMLLVIAGCKTTNSNAPSTQSITPGRIHVLLTDGTGPEVLLDAFSAYSFSLIGSASRSQNKYAYSYNAASVDDKSLLSKLKGHELVLDAEVMK